ncbi:TRAP-type C4-dicarboxylate transport system substrate-binding protein [Tepidamorphus gemmatus]|uniref:TRAP-type C4-dicarboxylate transport system substrate-binding protein n=1 Tax=Tepidamorphus gemmatus TaxID=747076 RepID=A0A4R3MGN9_9HYPH|nr:TRAP transporter substrate-binding protein [Tepidamorphus gemmatus]TCT12706.1 TRAP-type C4-dicarboxylate transport system substrate-binding protein [Tepidamorphus gemmatus]
MRRTALALTAAIALLGSTAIPALAQDVVLKIHQFLPAQAPIPANFIKPWAEKVEAESNGRIKFELYPAMQLGGAPPALYDQVRDGVADIVWTLPGYTPGRFPGTEAFELPFMPASGEATSQAAWEFYDKHLRDEFADVHIIAVHTHGPGLLHVKGDGVRKLEDMQGLKLRGPTRVITKLLEQLGATPVGMPVPAVPEALSKGVIDGTVIPWEVTRPLKVAELVDTHTGFSGDRGLYTSFFIFAMNKDKYESLPDDLKKVIDDNSGLETARWAGRVMDEGDIPGKAAAEARGNTIIILDEAETQRWKEASQPVIVAWIAEMNDKGLDGQALYEDAKALIAKYASGS